MNPISKEYAMGLYSLAEEEKTTREVRQELCAILEAFDKEPEYYDFLGAPNIPKAERTAAVDELLKGSGSEYVVSFVKLLTEHGYIRNFPDCVREYERLCDAAENIQTAEVSSAVELTAGEKEELKKRLEAMTGHNLRLEYRVDESLIGGVTVWVDGKCIDGSVKHRLSKMKEVMQDES